MVSNIKIQKVGALKSEFDVANTMLVMHYHGLTVADLEIMRRRFRKSNVRFQIVKNRLAKIAIGENHFSVCASLFQGPTAIAYGDDPATIAKLVVESSKENAKLKIMGGVYESAIIDVEKIKFLASLPSHDELRGQIIGMISSVPSKLVRTIKEPSSALARVISARSSQE